MSDNLLKLLIGKAVDKKVRSLIEGMRNLYPKAVFNGTRVKFVYPDGTETVEQNVQGPKGDAAKCDGVRVDGNDLILSFRGQGDVRASLAQLEKHFARTAPFLTLKKKNGIVARNNRLILNLSDGSEIDGGQLVTPEALANAVPKAVPEHQGFRFHYPDGSKSAHIDLTPTPGKDAPRIQGMRFEKGALVTSFDRGGEMKTDLTPVMRAAEKAQKFLKLKPKGGIKIERNKLVLYHQDGKREEVGDISTVVVSRKGGSTNITEINNQITEMQTQIVELTQANLTFVMEHEAFNTTIGNLTGIIEQLLETVGALEARITALEDLLDPGTPGDPPL